jgi:hypothetical protein
VAWEGLKAVYQVKEKFSSIGKIFQEKLFRLPCCLPSFQSGALKILRAFSQS